MFYSQIKICYYTAKDNTFINKNINYIFNFTIDYFF